MRRLAALVYGLPPDAGIHQFWGVREELAATQIEMAHEVRTAVIWSGRIHLGKDASKVTIPAPFHVPRPFDAVEPEAPPERMTLDSIRMALMGR